MEPLIQRINIEGLKDCPSFCNCDEAKVNEIIGELKVFQSNIRIDVKKATKCIRDLVGNYLHTKYPSYDNGETSNIIINSIKNTLNINDYKVLSILRISSNLIEHKDEGIMPEREYLRFTQETVLKIFLLFLGLIEQDYSKYFTNLDEVVNQSEAERIAKNGQRNKNNTKTDYTFILEFIERLNPNYETEDLYDFPIDDYEIIEKYPTDYGVDNLFENFTYKVKQNGTYHYIIPVKEEKKVSKREEEINSIIKNDVFSNNFLKFEVSSNLKTYDDSQHFSYRIYELKEKTQRLDEYTKNNEVSKLDALKMIKQLAEVLYEFKDNLHHRSLDEKAIFVNKINNGYILQISSFKYAKAAGEWEDRIEGETTSAIQIKELQENESRFSIVGNNFALMQEYYMIKDGPTEKTSPIYERFDAYSLLVLLAYILDCKTGVKEHLTIKPFSDFTKEFKNAIIETIEAESFDETIDLETLLKLLEGEINAIS